ncbi:MAG: hypothetical protein JJU15_09380 [Pararhodobacter sp.]|nr:hypothetical protein [Pararhodobacter sp.]
MIRLLPFALSALIGLPALADTAGDPAELARSWNGARVWLPDAPNYAADVQALDSTEVTGAVVLYAHGCDGLSRITDATGRFLARAGHAVIAPDSFARANKPVSCIPAQHRGSLHRRVLTWRQAELAHAMERIADTPGLRRLPLVLMGHSEGAITVATIAAPDAPRIIEGWTCHAGWPEYRGLNALHDTAVLALVGANDPWFRLPVLQGDCGAFMRDHPQGRSVVFQPPHYLHNRHYLSGDREVQALILSFIAESISAGLQ